MKLDHLLTTHRKINWKWNKDLNVRPEAIKNPRGNTGSKISDIAYSNILSDIPPQARETKEKINKWEYINLKSFCTAKEMDNKIKRQSTEWENIFTDISDKRLISKIYKNLKNSPPKQQTSPIKKWAKETQCGPAACKFLVWIHTSLKRTYRWPTDTWKDAQHH